MKNLFSLLLFSVLLCPAANAQLEKLLHQTFETKGVQEITLDLSGNEITVESWAGNLIMTETKITLENATPAILEHFIKMGRYEVLENRPEGATSLTLVSKDKERRAIKSTKGEFKETVNVRVFMPEFFSASNEKGPWTRRIEQTDMPPLESEVSPPIDTTEGN